MQPQTILHVITSLNLGGAETMMCQLLEHTDRTKFTPVVVSLRPESALSDRVRKAGITLHHLDMGSYLAMPLALRRLKELMRDLKPALVQTWMYHADLLGSLAARSMKQRPPVVWNVQHSTFNKQGTKFMSRVTRNILARFAATWPDKIISCSQTGIDLHATIGYPVSKMQHIVNGADVRRFLPNGAARAALREKLCLEPDTRVIGMAGRNDPQKDYSNFFAAIRELQKTDKKTCFIACGAGVTISDPDLARFRSQCPAPHNIFLLGPRGDMPNVYPAFDIATLSSAYGEGHPLTLTEALACAVPAVATDVGDSASVVGDSGITVQPCDPIALAAAWKKMLALPVDEYQRLRQRARTRAEERFSLPMIAAQYEALYEKLITTSAAASTQPVATFRPATV
jgi:glycosyltransferase involved in cell wall biosynthesis